MNLSVLIHTFNGYQHLWKGFLENWPYAGLFNFPMYFGTDVETDFDTSGFQKIYSGKGEWSDRLVRLLEQIPSEHILYMQEDHWPKNLLPDQFAMEMVEELDLYRLQLSPVNQFYSLHGSVIPLFFHQKSKYLVSHQPSIWKKSFLLECLKPNETPWQNEYAGTIRLNSRNDIREKIAIYPCDWYKHMCIKGKVVEMQ
jgi:hypothetical protein